MFLVYLRILPWIRFITLFMVKFPNFQISYSIIILEEKGDITFKKFRFSSTKQMWYNLSAKIWQLQKKMWDKTLKYLLALLDDPTLKWFIKIVLLSTTSKNVIYRDDQCKPEKCVVDYNIFFKHNKLRRNHIRMKI